MRSRIPLLILTLLAGTAVVSIVILLVIGAPDGEIELAPREVSTSPTTDSSLAGRKNLACHVSR